MMRKILACVAGVLLVFSSVAWSQSELGPPTLLDPVTLRDIANELSGSEALAHVLEITPYMRNRPAEEYGAGTYREAAYMAARAREYGLDDVVIERFEQAVPEWDAEMAELWITEPERRLVARYRDNPANLATGSVSADVHADLVYVGSGDSDADYVGQSVAGKIVLASGRVDRVHELAVLKYQAAGVVSFHNGSGKPEDRPDQVAWGRIGTGSQAAEAEEVDQASTFGFVLSHRVGTGLVDWLRTTPDVRAHAVVKTARYPAEHQVVTATIPGDGSVAPADKSEVVFIAHLFEGIAKQGANDNASGPAVQLELARAWLRLIEAGVVPPPRRTVRFLWVPEFIGTRAYIARYPEFLERVLGVINMDMVGASQSIHRHSLNVVTTPYSLPSFVNDLAIQFMEYVGETNHSKVTNRHTGFGFSNPVFDPQGSRDPFWFHISRFALGSDHQVFTEGEPRVPAVAFNNFHDYSYHTSEDSPMLLDPTQMKRASLIGLAMGLVMANTAGADSAAVATLSAAYGQRRLGEDLAAASMMIALASAEDVHAAYKEARNKMVWAYRREAAGVRSALNLAGTGGAVEEQIERIAKDLESGNSLGMERVETAYRARCMALGVRPLRRPESTEEERQADRLVPRRSAPTPDSAPSSSAGSERLGVYYALEARNYADGSRSLLEIRNAISAEFGPVPLADVVDFFSELQVSGAWVIDRR